jgi:hypothetical protein
MNRSIPFPIPSVVLIFYLPASRLYAFATSDRPDSKETLVIDKIILEGNMFTKSYVILREPFQRRRLGYFYVALGKRIEWV